MPPKGADEFLAEYFLRVLPRIQEEWKDIGRQSVYLVVWLVGLSVGIIVLIIGKAGEGSYLTPIATMAVIISLAIVIVCGVLQRVFYHREEALPFPLITGLEVFLTGYTNPSVAPMELQEHWDRDEIVRRLNENLGADYSFFS